MACPSPSPCMRDELGGGSGDRQQPGKKGKGEKCGIKRMGVGGREAQKGGTAPWSHAHWVPPMLKPGLVLVLIYTTLNCL